VDERQLDEVAEIVDLEGDLGAGFNGDPYISIKSIKIMYNGSTRSCR